LWHANETRVKRSANTHARDPTRTKKGGKNTTLRSTNGGIMCWGGGGKKKCGTQIKIENGTRPVPTGARSMESRMAIGGGLGKDAEVKGEVVIKSADYKKHCPRLLWTQKEPNWVWGWKKRKQQLERTDTPVF